MDDQRTLHWLREMKVLGRTQRDQSVQVEGR